MSKLATQLRLDRELRDAALAVVKADIAHLQGDLDDQGIGSRLVTRASEGAVDIFEQAVDVADDNRGALATLIAAVFVWFARNPIMALLSEPEPLQDADNDDEWDEEGADNDSDAAPYLSEEF